MKHFSREYNNNNSRPIANPTENGGLAPVKNLPTAMRRATTVDCQLLSFALESRRANDVDTERARVNKRHAVRREKTKNVER